ncbi:uncharacterized protein AB675_4581 [Cyphellophora attinorum]|uniref:RING-type domain-containing protein n=1 Tax=Cyphellophora attinorum TaxID=1664694 RepID=A0A0N0NLM3_9EURO|nr:uncharacterized protein AB675_4581 [Phialophora attinorum]KPI39199.1 hypothetical protein AB675_4581 [Phialophora attinorum]
MSSPPLQFTFSPPFPSNRETSATRYGSRNFPPRPPSPTTRTSRVGPLQVAPPRLFRDIFEGPAPAMPDPSLRTEAILPEPPDSGTHESFASAIRRTSRAVANAEEAFHTRGTVRVPIDLTGSPPSLDRSEGRRTHSREPGGAAADFISSTTHPDDNRSHFSHHLRLPSFFSDPVYGYVAPPPPAQPTQASDSLDRARSQRAQAFQRRARQLLSSSRRHSTAREEDNAVRRQRQNRITWQQTQARLRHYQEALHTRHHDVSLSSDDDLDSLSSDDSESSAEEEAADEMPPTSAIESVDLTNVDSSAEVANVLSKQRAEAILAQRAPGATEEGRTFFTAFKCPICMDSLSRATVTKCGHIFCHRCIVDTLKWSAQQDRDEHPARKTHDGHCPVCRQTLKIKDVKGPGRTLIPLQMKLLTLKTLKDTKGKRRADSIELGEASEPKRQRKSRTAKTKKTRQGRSTKREDSEDVFGAFTNDASIAEHVEGAAPARGVHD